MYRMSAGTQSSPLQPVTLNFDSPEIHSTDSDGIQSGKCKIVNVIS